MENLAFGVDPARSEKYSLRQSRYYALSLDISKLAGEHKKQGKRLKILDVGADGGVSMRHIEVQPHATNIDYYGADLKLGNVHKADKWIALYEGDFMEGYPDIPSDTFDVVICEQVLEHLPELETAVKTLERVLKPAGTLIVGVPIFPEGLHLARIYLVPLIDRLNPKAKFRSHVQAFSLRTFKNLLRHHTNLNIEQARGFRIISGGILRPLENHRWWWKFNNWLGAAVPGLCIEVQLVAKKPASVS